MELLPKEPLILAGELLLAELEQDGLTVRAYYWRRLRPTRYQWALVVSLNEYGPGFEPGLSRLLEVWDGADLALHGLRPLDLWALPVSDPEPARYARAIAGFESGRPCSYAGSEGLPPALLYRLPSA